VLRFRVLAFRLGTAFAQLQRRQNLSRENVIQAGTHTITQPDVLIVSDTLKDIRFVKNQLAAQAGVRFYAGAPLLTPEGYALGTLSVMDYVPRALTEMQTRILWALKTSRVNLTRFRSSSIRLLLLSSQPKSTICSSSRSKWSG
jgi:hypothetical protein